MDEVAFAVTPGKVEDISSAARAGRACAGRRGPDENLKERCWCERTNRWLWLTENDSGAADGRSDAAVSCRL